MNLTNAKSVWNGRVFSVPVLVVMGIAVLLSGVWVALGLAWPEEVADYQEIEIEVVGSEFAFYFQYPGADRTLASSDDRHGTKTLFVPAGAKVTLSLTSLDYIYTLEIPERGVYEMAAPDLVFTTVLPPSSPQSDELLGGQMCGGEHPGLIGRIVVQTTAEFHRTMATLSEQSLIANPS